MSHATCKNYFENLAARICDLWKARQYDELAFSDAAYTALTEDPPSQRVSFMDAVEFGLYTYPLPFQNDLEATFGQPPLTVYCHPEFRIEVLFWTRGFTGIHQHAFSGAFHVMVGSSLHTEWNFECEERVASQLLFGKLTLKKTELLAAGDTRPIIAGNHFIHATYHLDRPSVSVVVRTNGEKQHLPQYSYIPPSIAYEARHNDPVITRHLQLLKMLNSLGRYDGLIDALFDLLECASHHSTFHYLFWFYELFDDEVVRDQVLSWASRKHSQLVEVCRPALAYLDRREKTKNIREKITQPDLQYFMALLINVPKREEILKLIQGRYVDADPIAKITDWMRDLSRLSLLDPVFSDTWLESLPGLLSGVPPVCGEQALAAHCEPEAITAKARMTEPPANLISDYWLLRPLFHSAPNNNGSLHLESE